MKKLPLIGCVSLVLIGAGGKHKAHQHGSAKLDIAIESKDSTTAAIEFESSAEAIYGFEHAAKSDKDKAAVEKANTKLTNDFLTMVTFDAALGCVAKVAIDHHIDGKHSDVDVSAQITCQKPIAGSTVQLRFDHAFPGIQTVKVQAISAGTQSGSTIKKGGGSLKL